MAVKAGNFPFRPPRPLSGDLGVSRMAKIVVTADTTLNVDTNDEFRYNLLLNDCDADTDINIPIILLPSGTLIEDIGIEIFQVFTEAASVVLGDSVDSDGWFDTVTWICTDTMAIGRPIWLSKWAADGWMISTAFLDDTTAGAGPAYFQSANAAGAGGSGKIVYSDSAYSTAAIVGMDSDDEPRPHEYAIHLHQKEAQAITGGMAIYLKYNFAPLAFREPSSDLGDTGD